MIKPELSNLFTGYAKAVILPEIKCWIDNRLNLNGEISSYGRCYIGDSLEYYYETIKIYFDDINTLFSINIGVDKGKNKENIGQDVIFIEAQKFTKNDINAEIIYTETNDIEHWQWLLNKFYKKLAQYFNVTFN